MSEKEVHTDGVEMDADHKKVELEGKSFGVFMLSGVFIGVVVVLVLMLGYGSSVKEDPILTLEDKEELSYYRNKYGTLERIFSSIDESYYEDPQIDSFIEETLRGYLSHLGDPYLVYGGPELAKYYESRSIGTYKGTGLMLAYKSDGVYVDSFRMGTPAAKSGMRIGDKIITYGGVDISDRVIPKFKVGDIVEVEYERDGERKLVELEYVEGAQSNVYVDEVAGYDYIKLGQFTSGVVDDLEDHGELLGTGMILDLRGNTGGDVSEVIRMCEFFGVEAEVILGSDRYDDPVVRSSEGKTEKPKSIIYSTDKSKFTGYDGDVVILVDSMSASASEMLSELLKEKVGAKVIGEKTFGKGVAQTVMTTPRGGLLMIPISEYKLDSGTVVKSDTGVVLTEDVGSVEVKDEYYYSRDVERDKVLKIGLDMLKGDVVEESK